MFGKKVKYQIASPLNHEIAEKQLLNQQSDDNHFLNDLYQQLEKIQGENPQNFIAPMNAYIEYLNKLPNDDKKCEAIISINSAIDRLQNPQISPQESQDINPSSTEEIIKGLEDSKKLQNILRDLFRDEHADQLEEELNTDSESPAQELPTPEMNENSQENKPKGILEIINEEFSQDRFCLLSLNDEISTGAYSMAGINIIPSSIKR